MDIKSIWLVNISDQEVCIFILNWDMKTLGFCYFIQANHPVTLNEFLVHGGCDDI